MLGKTGVEKSTLLRNFLIQDIENGDGCALSDPHGDLARDLLDHIPQGRTDDVVYFSPADWARPIGLNILENVARDRRPLVAGSVVETFRSLYRDSWGPRMEYIFYNTIAALLDCPGATLLGVNRILADERYREWVVRRIEDPHVRNFWVEEFGNYDRRFRVEAIAPIQNKVGQFLKNPIIRDIVGQPRSTVDLAFMMNQRSEGGS